MSEPAVRLTAGFPLPPPARGTCTWCGQVVTYDPEADVWRAASGRTSCTGAERGATCAFDFYRSAGIDPLTLSFHDVSCSCQFSFPHHSYDAPAYVGPVPQCCGRPMRAMSDRWVCREHCGTELRPDS